jgi:hypothetical protein
MSDLYSSLFSFKICLFHKNRWFVICIAYLHVLLKKVIEINILCMVF